MEIRFLGVVPGQEYIMCRLFCFMVGCVLLAGGSLSRARSAWPDFSDDPAKLRFVVKCLQSQRSGEVLARWIGPSGKPLFSEVDRKKHDPSEIFNDGVSSVRTVAAVLAKEIDFSQDDVTTKKITLVSGKVLY